MSEITNAELFDVYLFVETFCAQFFDFENDLKNLSLRELSTLLLEEQDLQKSSIILREAEKRILNAGFEPTGDILDFLREPETIPCLLMPAFKVFVDTVVRARTGMDIQDLRQI